MPGPALASLSGCLAPCFPPGGMRSSCPPRLLPRLLAVVMVLGQHDIALGPHSPCDLSILRKSLGFRGGRI